MAQLNFRVIVVESATAIEKKIKDAISNHINKAARLSLPNIKKDVIKLLTQSINSSNEVKELKNGRLRLELGATRSEVDSTISFLISRLADTIVIDYKPFSVSGGKIGGYIEIMCFPKTIIDELISYPKAKFLTGKGVTIPWMEWLLTAGDRILVKRYTVVFTKGGNSRTGGVTMKPVKRGGWRIPSGFSGTRNDNFITRALDNLVDSIIDILNKEFIKRI